MNAPRSECTTALAELEQLQYDFLNGNYKADVVYGWHAASCLQEVSKRLGYRLLTDTI